ncbi:MAG: hypothetical protein KDA42_06905 [Planctomycetales bacterium]|nr:hypothetical protein [Planctomycetales bacterium]
MRLGTALLLLAHFAAPLQADLVGPRATIESLDIGFGGVFKVGHFVPARIVVQNAGRPQEVVVSVLVPDDQGRPCRFSSEAIQLDVNESREVVVLVKIGRPHGTALIQCSTASREFAFGFAGKDSAGQSIASTNELVLTFGGDVGVNEALQQGAAELTWEAHHVQVDNPSRLPTDSRAYDSIDAIALPTAEPNFFDTLIHDQPRREALQRWIRSGGRLMMCLGRRTPELVGTAGASLAPWPAQFVEMVPLRNTSSVESYAETNEPIDVSPLTEPLMMPRFEMPTGIVEAWAGNQAGELPLIVRSPVGFGEIAYVALDLDQPPMVQWEGRSGMINRLLNRQRPRLAETDLARQGAVNTIGYQEMSGQLRAALDRFGGVAFVSFWVIAVLIGLYAVAIGPLDYWLVHRLLNKPNATWVTFPLWGLLFAGIGVAATTRMKGDVSRLRQVELLDYDLTVPQYARLRTTAWFNFFAPRADTYEFEYEPATPDPAENPQVNAATLSWLGLPGGGLGGMRTRSTAQDLWSRAYNADPASTRLSSMPLRSWSTQAFVARCEAQVASPLDSQLMIGANGLLRGTLVNRLPVELSEVFLFYDRWVYRVDRIASAEAFTLDARRSPLDARTVLTRKTKRGDTDAAEVYDPQSSDIARILEVQMFHNFVGGAAYTALENRYQGFIDWSRLLADGRAILVARLDGPAGRFVCHPLDVAAENYDATTLVRFVLPVQESQDKSP